MLKFTLKRVLFSKPWIIRSQFKSKATLGKDEDIEDTTPGQNGQPKMALPHRYLPDSLSQLASNSVERSHFDEAGSRRYCFTFAGRLDESWQACWSYLQPVRFIDNISLLLPSLNVGHILHRRRPNYILLHTERARLETYCDWQNAAVTPRSLAKDGFYFTGVSDLVQCVFCLGVLEDWITEDGDGIPRDQYPAYRHRHRSPHCPFVRGLDVHNIPVDHNDELQQVQDLGLHVPLGNPVQESDDHMVPMTVWNAASRTVFVGVQLRPHLMPINWSSLGISLRDPNLEISLGHLAQADGNNQDIRALFAAMLSDNMAISYRNTHARYLGNVGVIARDVQLHDLIHLEHSIVSLPHAP